MKVSLLLEDLYEEYEDFLKGRKGALLYHSVKYKKMLQEVLDCQAHYLIAHDTCRIHAVLPLMIKNGTWGKVINSLPYYGSNGGILADNEKAASLLIKAYHEMLRKDDVLSSVVIDNPLLPQQSYFQHNLKDQRISQWTTLYPFDEQASQKLMEAFHSSARRNVRKAIKSEVKCAIENNQFDFLYEIHNDNISAIGGLSKSKEFFKAIRRIFTTGEDYNLYVARSGSRPVAALLLFYYNNIVEYYTPAIVSEFRSMQPLALLIYQAMCDASQRGFNLWNWGGTWENQNGVYKFKKKWAAKDLQYNYYIQLQKSEIIRSESADILRLYPSFYVLPFTALEGT